MTAGNQGAGSQAGQQSQGSGSQGNQGSQQGQQSLGDQLYGQQSNQQGGQQGGQQGTSGNQSGTGQSQSFEGQRQGESLADYVARINSELGRARGDAARYRTSLRKYEGDTQQDGEGQTEFQRLSKQFETLQRDLETERNARKADRLNSTLITALAEVGAVNPARAARLIDVDQELELGQDGTPTKESLAAAIANLQRDTPGIFKDVRGSGDGGAGNTGGVDPQDFNAAIRARAGYRPS
jgi:hypothetical protein